MRKMEKMDKHDKVIRSMEIMLDYKNGVTKKELAIQLFSDATGLTIDISEEFFQGIKKDNIVHLYTSDRNNED